MAFLVESVFGVESSPFCGARRIQATHSREDSARSSPTVNLTGSTVLGFAVLQNDLVFIEGALTNLAPSLQTSTDQFVQPRYVLTSDLT